MRVKCSNLIVVILVFFTFFLVEKCDFALLVRNSSLDNHTYENSPVTTICNISHKTEAFCVPIRNCLTLLIRLNASDLRARRCGPRNENFKNPFVCCEKHYVQLEAAQSSTTPKTLASETPEPISPIFGPPEYQQPVEPPSNQKTSGTIHFPDVKNPFERCGVQDIVSRIVGGKPAVMKEFPWLGRLLRRDSHGEMIFSCTGALITSRVVLTTAHCLVSNSLVKMGDLHAVSLGEHQTECNFEATECLLNKKTVIVSEHIAHPGYNANSRNHDNDIGLVILRDEVKFTKYITPICLLENGMEATEYYVAGWGKTEVGAVSGVKLKIAIPPFTWEQCAKKYTEIRVELTPRQICAGGVEGMDSCQGDSGGPLMVRREMKWYVAGVVSFGLGCGRKGWPGIYVYIPNYIDWIKEIVRERAS